jgi:hypothetical protein
MVSMFLTHAVPASTAPAAVFFGSSVAYGYPWQEEVIVSAAYARQRPDQHVLNVSVVGADLAFLDDAVLCGASNAGLRADAVIIEFPVVNSVNNRVRIAQWEVPPTCDETIGPVGYWSFVMRHPLGAGWLPFIWDNKAFAKADQHLMHPRVYGGFFVSVTEFAVIEPQFRVEIAAVLARAKTIGRRVYAFPSPVFLAGVQEAGYAAESVRTQLASALAACREVPGVDCLDPAPFYARRDLYLNLTHFNQRGNQAFGEWLAAAVERPRE